MKRISTLILLLLSLCFAHAQNSYIATPIPYNPDPFNAGTPTNINQDDIWGPVLALPFNFCFYDQSYSSIVIGSNGIVSFDPIYANTACEWMLSFPAPNVNIPSHAIMAPYQDIDPSVGGSINYDVRGVAPYRRFIISYYMIPMFSCNNMAFSEQVVLYETTNVIETHILNKPLCVTWNGGAAMHGLEIDGNTAFLATGRNFPTQWSVTSDGYRFTPVGTCAGPAPADSVRGKVYVDYNNNCTQDPNEFPITNRSILANGGQYYAWTDLTGAYEMGMAPGFYAINQQNPSPFYLNSCLPTGTYNVALSASVVNGLDFADSAAAVCSDLSVGIGSWGLRRCRESDIAVTYCNNGTYPDSNVVVTVTLLDSIAIDSSSMPFTTLGSNTYSFSVGDLMIGQCGNIVLHCSVGCDPAGTVYCMSADIVGTYATECDTVNNHDLDCQALLAPLDPNAKYVAAQDFAGQGYLQDENISNDDDLTYIIHFQNVGTVMAQDIELRDTLSSYLDPATLRAGAASAPYTYSVVGNRVRFRFENINLPDSISNEPGSHGFVKFSIAQRPGNVPGNVIYNEASIYFDFEAPVVTNQTVNTITTVGTVKPRQQDVAQIYPNPGQDQLIVQCRVVMDMTFVLYDITGKELRRVPVSGLRTTVSTADLGLGVYLYRLEADGKMLEAGKWMKQ